jgi:hypothetical protein
MLLERLDDASISTRSSYEERPSKNNHIRRTRGTTLTQSRSSLIRVLCRDCPLFRMLNPDSGLLSTRAFALGTALAAPSRPADRRQGCLFAPLPRAAERRQGRSYRCANRVNSVICLPQSNGGACAPLRVVPPLALLRGQHSKHAATSRGDPCEDCAVE